jgi:signal transduction histidine kinase/CheY-like chemotaxis protein
VVGSVVLFTDVSARRAADAQRAALEARLRQAQKMEALGQLAGGIAHDFNNLLTVIGGNVDLLHGDLPPELPEGHPARRDLEEITHAAERARGLVRQLLTFSRQQPVKPERLRVGDAVRRIERLLRRVIGEEITLAVDTADAGAVVLADAGQLEQIVMNLAANARDAMLTPLHGTAGTGGTLHIGVDAVTLDGVAARDWDGASAGRWVRLRVRDTGHGMDAATQAHVFEPFFTTKEVGRGTGLGLATVFGVVRQMGGAVRVESAPGRGSTFTVILPVADGDVDGVPPPTRAGVPSAAAGTVLLVEDEAAVRVTARRILERLGYTVLEARDGADALTRWRRHRGGIDAVVTDVRMPEMSGPAFVARVREDAPGTGVVFMSGYVDEDTSLAQGPHETFIEKPFTAEALAAALEHVRRGAGRR